PSNALATQRDITANPKGLKFRELDSAMLPRVLDQVDLALINTNYALDAGLDPTRDALAIEGSDSPYVNFLVARADNRDDPRVQALARALTSAEVKAFIEQKYRGAVLPAFWAMPVLLAILLAVLLAAGLMLLLLPLSLWQRYRVARSRRQAIGWVVGLAWWSALASSLLMLLSTALAGLLWPLAWSYVAMAYPAGLLLGAAGHALTRFEPTPARRP